MGFFNTVDLETLRLHFPVFCETLELLTLRKSALQAMRSWGNECLALIFTINEKKEELASLNMTKKNLGLASSELSTKVADFNKKVESTKIDFELSPEIVKSIGTTKVEAMKAERVRLQKELLRLKNQADLTEQALKGIES